MCQAPRIDVSWLLILCSDPDRKLEFTLVFQPSGTATSPNTNQPTLAALRDNISAAHDRVREKKIILDKIGKARGVISFVKTVGEAVKDVCITNDDIMRPFLLTSTPDPSCDRRSISSFQSTI